MLFKFRNDLNITGFLPFSATCAAKTEQNRRFWFPAAFAARKCEAFQAKTENPNEMLAFRLS